MSRLQELIQTLCPNGVEYKRLGKIVVIKNGRNYKHLTKGTIPVYGSGGIMTYVNEFTYNKPTVLIPRKGSLGNLFYVDTPFWNVDTIFYTEVDTSQIIAKYLYYFLAKEHLENLNKAGGVPSLTQSILNKIEIPLPPLEIQAEIVRILDAFTSYAAELQAELQARKEQYAYYRDRLLTFDEYAEGVEWKKLREILHSIRTGLNPRNFFKLNTSDATSYYVTIREFNGGNLIFTEATDRINETARKLCNNRSNLECNDVLFSGTGTIGETYVINSTPSNWNIKEGVYSLKPKIHFILPKYLKYILSQSEIKANYLKLAEGGTVKSISMKKLGNFPIPIPSIQEQQRIVSFLDKFEALVNDLTEGLPAEIAAVQEQYEYYRNKLLSFPKLTEA